MAYVIIGALGGASKCVPKGRGGPTSFHSLRGDAKCVPKCASIIGALGGASKWGFK